MRPRNASRSRSGGHFTPLCASAASRSGSLSPATIASSMARPLLPSTSASTASSLMLAASSVLWMRCAWRLRSRVSCLRVRNSVRRSWVAESGTKLARSRPCASSSASQTASLTSLLRPGTFFTCAAFARSSSKSPSERICQTGFQYTPVASIATGVTPFSASQSANPNRPAVVAAKVFTSVTTLPSLASRTQATTVSLWTSRPAQRGCRSSIAILLCVAGQGPRQGYSHTRAPRPYGRLATVGGAPRSHGQTQDRAEHAPRELPTSTPTTTRVCHSFIRGGSAMPVGNSRMMGASLSV